MDTKPWSGFRAWLYALIFRSPKSNRLVVELSELTAGDRTLDIGCGPGAAVRLAADIVVAGEAVGVDRAEPMVQIARKRSGDRPNIDFRVGSAESLPFEDNSFTVVWTAHSYHHWEDPAAGLLEVKRVLRPGGRALILEQDEKKHGLTADQADDLSAHLEGIGFGPIVIERLDKQVVLTAHLGTSAR